MIDEIKKNLTSLRQTIPFISNLIDPCGGEFLTNGLLAIGASPLSPKGDQDLEETISLSSALVVHTGTINGKNQNAYSKAIAFANAIDLPIIVDVSGATLTPYRRGIAHQLLLSHKIHLIRGNISEILAISGQSFKQPPTPQEKHTHETIKIGKDLSQRHEICVVMTGKEDAIIVHNRHRIFDYGHVLMPRIAGAGHLLTAVLAAFNSVNKDIFAAASSGVVVYGMAGEAAAESSCVQGPGTFKAAFLDALHTLSEENLQKRYRHG